METSRATAGTVRPPRSRWNLYVEALLASGTLTVAEHRLALAYMRLIPGYRKEERELGDRLLRKTARLDGRSFARARDSLVAKGLISYAVDGRRRTHYWLGYGDAPESGQGVTAPERSEVTAVERAEVTRPERGRNEALEKASKEELLREVPNDRATEVARRVSERSWMLRLVLNEVANGKALDELTPDELTDVEGWLDFMEADDDEQEALL